MTFGERRGGDSVKCNLGCDILRLLKENSSAGIIGYGCYSRSRAVNASSLRYNCFAKSV